jgi:hypothetical protein
MISKRRKTTLQDFPHNVKTLHDTQSKRLKLQKDEQTAM